VEGKAFEDLKDTLTSAHVLVTPDPTLPYEVYTDASKFALGAVLLQNQGKGLQPVAYLSRKLNSAERNYPTGDREMLGIYYALQTWRCYLEGASFKVNSDHLNHTWFNKKKDLSTAAQRLNISRARTTCQTPCHVAQTWHHSCQASLMALFWTSCARVTRPTPCT
jgi:hypothetical protein